MTTVQRLRKARALLASPKGWTKGSSIKVLKDGTVAYCAVGVLNSVGAGPTAFKMVRNAIKELFGTAWSLVPFNDHKMTHKRDILAVFDRAIQIAEARTEARKNG